MSTAVAWPGRPDAAPAAAPVITSLVLRGELRAGDRSLMPDIAVLERFLAAYGPWFHEQVVMLGRLDLVYGRSFVLAMSGLLHVPEMVERLARAARAIGLAVELAISADECLDAAGVDDAVDRLLAAVDGVHLAIEPAVAAAHRDVVRRLVDQTLAARTSLNFVASPAVLRALGVLRDPAFSARYATVFADEPRPGRRVKVPGVTTMPCRGHLRLYIDAQGDVYPCAGLFGVPAARLGNVHDADPACLFADRPALDLAALAQHGPAPADPPPVAPFDLCERHRATLQSQEPSA